ncbi:hypothetical protein LTR24_008377 [Lithohypha guttulata]|uniref:Uncharacterized protein n=1 Tax=Lithohypha guttulata TaxID=1690604 RepID=A0ABR0K059_9EURO|nr:hypothetical protein LTR24_008377 [Lithohypha guttulata]
MSSELIQTGFWIDHSKGLVMGATLTYNSRWGSLLVTAASVIVQITGTAAWALVAFWLHQHLTPADHTCQDELEAQRSVVLRNSGAVSAILDLYSIGKTWHGHSPRAWRRSVTAMAMPLLIVVGFAVAGVLVASIALDPQQSHGLVQPGLCGLILGETFAGSDSDLMHTNYYFRSNTTSSAKTYAQQCYARQGWGTSECNSFAVPALSYRNGTIPYKNITTSGLDTYTTTSYNMSDLSMFPETVGISNLSRLLGGTDYNVRSYQFYLIEHDMTWILIDKGSVLYSGLNSGPVFTTEPAPSGKSDLAGILYRPLELASLIICTESYQFCNPRNQKCTPWVGQYYFTDVFSASGVNESIIEDLEFNEVQNATYYRMNPFTSSISVYTVTTNTSPLRASQQIVLPPYSVPLPPNQWELEVESWYQTALAKLQIVSHAWTDIPPWISDTYEIVPGDSPEARRQCFTQRRLLPAGYQSYSVFGMAITTVMGLVSIVIAFAIRQFHGSLLPHRRRNEEYHDRYLAFVAEGQLQLHRAALEGSGFHGWVDDANSKSVPYVRCGSKRFPVAILAKGMIRKESHLDGRVDHRPINDASHLLPEGEDREIPMQTVAPKLPAMDRLSGSDWDDILKRT